MADQADSTAQEKYIVCLSLGETDSMLAQMDEESISSPQ